MKKSTSISIRLAAAMTAGALAACGGGGESTTSTPLPTTSPATGSPAATPAPASDAAPDPAPAPGPAPAPAPSQAAPVGNALVGKQLYSKIWSTAPGSNSPCSECHISINDLRSRATTEAGYRALILNAIYGDSSGIDDMRGLRTLVLETDIDNLAAYLATPEL